MNSINFDQLESTLQRLLERCDRLQQENAMLRQQQTILERDYRKLQERNRMAGNRVESIIDRLQGIENG